MTREQRDQARELTHRFLRRLLGYYEGDAREVYLLVADIAECGRAEMDKAKRENGGRRG